MRMSSPPTSNSALYGIATPARRRARARFDVAAMAQFIGVEPCFVSIDGLYRAMGTPGRDPLRRPFALPASPATTHPLIDHNAAGLDPSSPAPETV